ncbi:MAG: TonB-dependent receptor [Bacteroidales bacterium]
MRFLLNLFVLLVFSLTSIASNHQHGGKDAVIKGVVLSKDDGSQLQFATISVDDNSLYGCVTDEQGRFELKLPAGEYRIVAAYIGYEKFEQVVNIKPKEKIHLKIELSESAVGMGELVVVGDNSSTKLKKSAYNVQSLTIGNLKNSTANMTDALSKIGGVKIRETGGLGSDANISINGFSGSHVKIFIDGIQLDENNSAFSLSNMPANYAERIDVYSGVVPIEFGADAIGGVINIVTKKDTRLRSTSIDASYSYGSFNTHSTYVNFSQVLGNGITYGINLYQNYSDNNYWVDATVTQYTETSLGYPMVNTSDKTLYHVQRFNDAYHNETGIATIGISNKSWTDALLFKFNYSQYFNEIQTGNRQDWVYGDKERVGYSLTPTLDFSKHDLFTEGLDITVSANYSAGYTHNYAPGGYSYNWLGEAYVNSTISSQDSEQKNNSSNINFIAKYVPTDNHEITLSNNFNYSSRITRSVESGTDAYTDWSTPKVGSKDITGLSYRYHLRDKFDATAFGKYYWQANEGFIYDSDTGEYEWMSSVNNLFGYGGAVTYFPIRGLQAKLSYELAYRLPTSTEIFGDEDLEVGTFELLPETSDNLNLNIGYNRGFKKHYFHADGGLIYRYTRDYIVRSVSTATTSSAAGYTNFGKVETKGFTLSARYSYDKIFSVGGTYSDISPRNDEEALYDGTSYETVTYGVRIPNQPYRYANGDGSYSFFDLFFKKDVLTLTYDVFYQHEFPLGWENLGNAATKSIVPTQLAHNATLAYSIKGGRYNFVIEARNMTDAKLYDNYSLQKAGRAFYAKFRYNFVSTREDK